MLLKSIEQFSIVMRSVSACFSDLHALLCNIAYMPLKNIRLAVSLFKYLDVQNFLFLHVYRDYSLNPSSPDLPLLSHPLASVADLNARAVIAYKDGVFKINLLEIEIQIIVSSSCVAVMIYRKTINFL